MLYNNIVIVISLVAGVWIWWIWIGMH